MTVLWIQPTVGLRKADFALVLDDQLERRRSFSYRKAQHLIYMGEHRCFHRHNHLLSHQDLAFPCP